MRKALTLFLLSLASSLTAYSAPRRYDWSGLYIGGYLGGAWGGRVTIREKVPFNPGSGSWENDLNTSWIGGGTLGYNFQRCSWLFGLENEAGYIQLRGTTPDPHSAGFSTVAKAKLGCFYDVIAFRAGYACNCLLLYGKIGFGIARIRGQVDDSLLRPFQVHASEHRYAKSWAAGVGLEYGFCRHLSTKAEYLYIHVRDSLTSSFDSPPQTPGAWRHDFHGVHTIKLGLNYRFSLCSRRY